MKKGLLLFALVCIGTSLFALNRYELILGLRGGAGAMLYRLRNTTDVTPYTEKNIGISVPGKGEVLFGLNGFRMGYRFEYVHGIFTRNRRDFDNGSIPDLDVSNHHRRHLFTHLFVLEAAIPTSQRFAIVPAIGLGGFRGYTYFESNDTKSYYKDNLRARFVAQFSLGFELTKKRFSFVIAPTYSYYHLKSKTDNNIRGAFHNVGLDLAFRLNLLKPRPMRS